MERLSKHAPVCEEFYMGVSFCTVLKFDRTKLKNGEAEILKLV